MSILDDSVAKKLNFSSLKKGSVFDNAEIMKISGSDNDSDTSVKLPIKRTSGGSFTCSCRGICGARCGCRKSGSSCHLKCRCPKDQCTNKSEVSYLQF